jgi:glucokinase
MAARSVIGIDVGGTKIAAGTLWLPDLRLGSSRVIPTGAARGGAAVLQSVLGLARELRRESESEGAEVAAIGLGICELVDRSGRIASANAIHWLGMPVREELAAIAPARLEADVRAAAMAEFWLGAGRPFQNFLYVTVGTGISSCLVLNGEPYLGARGLTGTMASSPLAVPCERCGHTNRMSLEEIASGPALAARVQAGGGTAASGQQVFAALQQGDAVAERVVNSASQALGSQVGLLVNTLDPQAVVIGGGLGLSGGTYWANFIRSTREHIWSHLHRELPVLRAETGSNAGWVGAALSAAREHLALTRP